MTSTAGCLTIVGLGPGAAEWVTPAASAAVADATHVLGYDSYVARLSPVPGQIVVATGNRVELDRAADALALAASGHRVVLVSGGDPGVFAMAAAVFEAIDHGPAAWRALDVRVEPGVTAMLAAASRIGAPLGADFCAISLSDNLKPWDVIARRLKLAAEADLVIALYNPASPARPEHISRAFDVLRLVHPATVPVMLARACGRPDEDITVTTLGEAHTHPVDMRTVVIIGSSATRVIARAEGRPWVYSPRFVRS